MILARPKGSTNKPKGTPATAGPGHNIGQTDDDQRHALTLVHRGQYESALATKKAADAAFKNICKLARADLGSTAIDDIKESIEFQKEGSDEKFKLEMERRLRNARWAGIEVGFQTSLFDGSERSLKERAFDEGKRAGIASTGPLKPPANYSPGSDGFIGYTEGWHEGQKALFAIKKGPEPKDAGLIVADGNKPAGPDDFDTGGEGGEPPADGGVTSPGDATAAAGAEGGGEQTMWPDDEAAAAKKKAAAGAPSTETVN